MKIFAKITNAVYGLFPFSVAFYINVKMNNAWYREENSHCIWWSFFSTPTFFFHSFEFAFLCLPESFVSFFFFCRCKLGKLISIHCEPFFTIRLFSAITSLKYEFGYHFWPWQTNRHYLQLKKNICIRTNIQ